MPRVAVADRRQIAAIYRESHPLWGVGLSQSDYEGLWDEISATPWARRHARFLVWTERGEILSSLKLYRPRVRLMGRVSRCSILGAIFTPKLERRRGHATDLMRAVLAHSRERGDPIALLYSDIGTAYYEALGFRAIPAEEQWGRLPRRPKQPEGDWSLRSATPADGGRIEAAHDRSTRCRAMALVRDPEHWQFLRLRSKSYFERLRDPEVRQGTYVVERSGRFEGFLTTVDGRSEWNVREIGARDGDPRLMAQLLRVGAIHARRAGLTRCYAWLPPELLREGLGELRLRSGPRRRAVPMVLPLDSQLDLAPLGRPESAFIPFQDQF